MSDDYSVPDGRTRRVDTPDHIIQAARSLLGWSLGEHRTTYSQTAGVRVELRLQSRGGRLIPRSAFRSTPQWDVEDFRCVVHHEQATVWLKLRQRFD